MGSKFFTLLIFLLCTNPWYSYFICEFPDDYFGAIEVLWFLHILILIIFISSFFLFSNHNIVNLCLFWYLEWSKYSSFHIKVSVKYTKVLKLYWHLQSFNIDSDLLKNSVLSNQYIHQSRWIFTEKKGRKSLFLMNKHFLNKDVLVVKHFLCYTATKT